MKCYLRDMMELSDTALLWLEKHNPLLLRERLDQIGCLNSPKEIKVYPSTEVLIVRGVDVSLTLLEGIEVLLIEDDLSKIAAFLHQKDFLPHQKLFLSTSSKEQLYPIIRKFAFKNIQYYGQLQEIQAAVDGMKMSYSEYRDLGLHIIPNILANLLHIDSYIDGRDLSKLLIDEEAIICGNGLSLKKGIEEIKQQKNRPLIFSVGSSLPVLLEAGIIPDFFVVIDPSPPVELYKCLKQISIPIFYQNRASKEILHLHQGPKIFMGSCHGWQIEDVLMQELERENFSFDGGWHAGNFGAHVALALGCSKITLVGMDGIAKGLEESSLKVEGKSTRGDLYYGMDFFSLLLEYFPGRTICHYTFGFSFEGATLVDHLEVKGKLSEIKLPLPKKVDQEKVKDAIDRMFDHQMLESLGNFMSTIKQEGALANVSAACLLAELSLEPLYQHFCLPMWEIWKNVIENSKDILSQITFTYQLLKPFCEKTGRVGSLFYLFGKREGFFKRVDANGVVRAQGNYFNGLSCGVFTHYDESGRLRACQPMKEGLRDGKYQVYDGGVLVREGEFKQGLSHGKHLCYIQGKIVDEISYSEGAKTGVHKVYSDCGVKVEEIEYKEGDRFDRKKFDENGSIVYSGTWKGDEFEEVGYDNEIKMFTRLGKMVDKKLVFKEDF